MNVNFIVNNVNDAPTGTVSITGTLRQGQTLNALHSLTDADGLGQITYTWKNDLGIVLGNAPALFLTQAHVGRKISVTASYTDLNNTFESKTSSLTSSTIANINDAPEGTDKTITLLEDGSYTFSAADFGFKDLGDSTANAFHSVIITSPATGTLMNSGVAVAPNTTITVTVANIPKLVYKPALNGNGNGYSSFSFKVKDNGGTSYGGKDVDETANFITFNVTPVNDAPTGSVSISGVTKQGETLTASDSLVDPDGKGEVTYTWKDDTGLVLGSGNSFVLAQAQVGKKLTVTASYTDSYGILESKTSGASAVVANVNDAPTLSISGTPTQGQILKAMLADPDGGNSEFRVNSTLYGSSQQNQNITSLADGGFLITWRSFVQDGSEGGIYAQRYAANGSAIGSEFQVNTYTTGHQDSPCATSLTDGGFLITWYSYDPGHTGFYAQRYAADGNTISSEFQVNTAKALGTLLVDGGYVHTWAATPPSDIYPDIFAQRYAADGNAIGSAFLVNTFTSDNQSTPIATALAGGGFLITWISHGREFWDGGFGIYAQRYAANGNTIGSEFRVNTYTTNDQDQPGVTSLADGGFLIIWRSADQDGSGSGIYAQRYDDKGLAIGGEFRVNTYTTGRQDEHVVTSLVDGGFLVAWSSAGQDGDSCSIYAQRYAADGNAIGSEFRVNNDTTTGQGTPSVTSLADGGFLITWQLSAQDGLDIYAQRYDANGSEVLGASFQWMRDGINISGSTGTSYTLTEDDVGKSITVKANYVDKGLTAESIISSPTAPIANINDLGSVSINGIVQQGALLTARVTDLDGVPSEITYQWQADGIDIGGATAATFTPTQAQVGKPLTVKVSYTDGHGTLESQITSVGIVVANVNDLGSLSISGEVKQGQVLTAVLTDLDGVPGGVTYQWKANGVNINGATGVTFSPTQEQVRKTLTVTTSSYTDSFGTLESEKTSVGTLVANVNDLGSVSISGQVKQGQILTAVLTDPDGDPSGVTYQWKADGINIGGATAATFTPTQAQVGKLLTVTTSSYTDGFGTIEAAKTSLGIVVANINDPSSIGISGTFQQGQVVTAMLADLDGLPTVINYQWLRDGSNITNATAQTYTLGATDYGHSISISASYVDLQGTPESIISNSYFVSNPPSQSLGTLVIEERESVVITSNQINAIDDFSPAGNITFSISNLSHGSFEKLNGTSWIPTLTFTKADIAAGKVRFTHDGSEIAPGFSIKASDGVQSSVTSNMQISFSNTNDAPVIVTAQPLIGNASYTALTSDMLKASDADSSDAPANLTYTWSWDGGTSPSLIHSGGTFHKRIDSTYYTIQSFTQEDINNNVIYFKSNQSDAHFINFTVSDALGAKSSQELAGVDTDTLNRYLSWGGGFVDYCFLSSVPNYYDSSDAERVGFTELNQTQKSDIRNTLNKISQLINLTFIEVSDPAQSEVTFAATMMPDQDTAAYTYMGNPGYNSKTGDIWLDNLKTDSYIPGTYDYKTLIHEIGHSLFLKHPYDNGSTSNNGSAPETNSKFTVMSYNDKYTEVKLDYYYAWPETYMRDDLVYLQQLYGQNTNTNVGDTIYTFSGFNNHILTVWDAGGVDNFDMSAATYGVVIDLREGHFSTIWKNPADVSEVAVDTICVAIGTVIENANGGNYNDTLNGNLSANILNGGFGNDTINGYGGADVINGGNGNDLIVVADKEFSSINGGAGTDTLRIQGAAFDFTDLGPNAVVSVEIIDLRSDSGAQRLRLKANDVLDFGNGIATSALLIIGDTSDTVDLDRNITDYTKGSRYTGGGIYYDLWHSNASSNADILIQQGIAVV